MHKNSIYGFIKIDVLDVLNENREEMPPCLQHLKIGEIVKVELECFVSDTQVNTKTNINDGVRLETLKILTVVNKGE